eukprot:1969365-Rhodomonas_salina.3
MGSCIDKMKQRQEEMEEDKEEYRRQMQARMQEMEYAAKQRLDNLEREKLALEAKLDALVQQQVPLPTMCHASASPVARSCPEGAARKHSDGASADG